MPRGGKRPGAGRPRKEPTKRISVPARFVDNIMEFINHLLGKDEDNKRT